MADVSVVVVTYNSRAYIGRCLSALRRSSCRPSQTIVVDNASTDGTPELVRDEYPEVRLIESGRNAGFGAASNIGIAASATDYVLLLNPDALVEEDSLGTLMRFMEENPGVGISGCRLVNDDGSLQTSIGKFPTLANQIGRYLMLYRVLPWVSALKELETRPERYTRTRDVEWVYGAVMLARRTAFEDVGVFDERFFLFSEEVDWCLRMERGGWRVVYVAEATVHHIGRGGVGAPEVYVHLLNSKYAFIAKHNGRIAAAFARALLVVGLSIRYAGTVAQTAFASSAASERKRRAFASGIRWALSSKGMQ